MQIKFWGTRGDVSSPERDKLKYGGNTQCIELKSPNPKSKIYIDAGIGLILAGRNIPQEKDIFHIVLTHYHWDHIQGILPFLPFFMKKNKIYIYGHANSESELKDYLNTLYMYVFSPLGTIDYYSAMVYYRPFQIGQEFEVEGIKFKPMRLNHGDYTMGFRVTENDKSFVLASDHEANMKSRLNDTLINESRGADLLIHNCKYTDEDYLKHEHQGHSSISGAVENAKLAEIKKLALIHYNPYYNDAKIDKMIEFGKSIDDDIEVFGAREGNVLTI